ncbi:hypothetical protein PVT01_000107800 [Plasmodium vivax]|uniref:VIR protein n=1 Tax=Plasmodium vivax TaxID=5855 RepID=A0A1G4E8R4_PLAVI|nr:hypothetical protein PVT01_000107800 [Plasmodium vivax]
MWCDPKISEQSYDFFDNILTYINCAKQVEDDVSIQQKYDECDGFSRQYIKQHTQKGKKICEHYLKLYNSLINETNNPQTDPNYETKLKFLNYWLNFKLKESGINKTTCVNSFASLMDNYLWKALPFNYTSHFTHNIKEEDLNKMNVLHNLYNTYNKIHSALKKEPCTPEDLILDCSDTCFDEYKVFMSGCIGIKNKFCDELEKFKKLYETLYRTVEDKGDQFSKYFKRLPEDQNINIISTTLLGSTIGLIPLIGILYKFTPLRQVFKPEKKKLPKSYSNNDEELRNISLSNHKYEQLTWNKERYNIKYN